MAKRPPTMFPAAPPERHKRPAESPATKAEAAERRPASAPAEPAATRLQAELLQRLPFASLEQGVYLSVLRTADVLARGSEDTLKPFGLTRTQYNVLRILRGAGPGGLSCREVGERMLTHDPDVTRLLDRLERGGLITRGREKDDRRVITTRITAEGLRVLAELDEPMAQLHRRQLAHLGAERLRTLIELLEVVRGTRP